MNNICTNNWKEFKIGGKNGLFEVTRPNARSAQTYSDGDMPYIASGCFNNGVCGYFEQKDKNDFDKGNCITVSPVDGYAFYQKDDFLGRGGAGSSIIILRRDNLNEYVGKFICTIIRKACKEWTYSNMGNKDKLKDTIIKLPVNKNNEPDWEYMESYMKNIMQESEENIGNLQNINSFKNIIKINQWKKFHLYDKGLFLIDMGTKLDKAKMTVSKPTINFVGRANSNNGITASIDIINGITPYKAGNMTLSLGGEYLGSCFIQPKDFYTSQNVVVLIPQWDMPNEVKMFLGTMIFRESRTHYKAFVDELNRHIKTDFSFYLPVTSNDEPDWYYMENYMKNIIQDTQSKLDKLVCC